MSREDRTALFLSLLAVLLSWWVADRYLERMAHLEDEMAYVWQADLIAQGRLALPASPQPRSLLVPFVVDYNGQRFGKYPLGWPVVLAAGEFFGRRDLVNPLLAGFGIWLTYLLGKRIFSPRAGLLAAVLTISSPFFLINSGSLLSHPLGLVLSAAFALAWLDAFSRPPVSRPWLAASVAGLALALLVLTRPLSALGVALPFGVHGLVLLLRGNRVTRLQVLLVGLLALVGVLLLLAWQWAVTGDPFLNPYTLWWPYDKVGFGPGVGPDPVTGHTLEQAWINTEDSLNSGLRDFFGWGKYSWLFLPAGLWVLLRTPGDVRRQGLLAGSVFVSLVIIYLAYWIGSWLFGPRYYYEGFYSVSLLSAAGILFLAGRLGQARKLSGGWAPWRARLVLLCVTGLLAYNLFVYLPERLAGMYGLYGISRERLEPFLQPEAQALTPALVFVNPDKSWTEYGALLELQDASLTTPFIFAYMRSASFNAQVKALFPDRAVFYYYPDTPYKFYTAPRWPVIP